jgi:hypothetical protein
LNSNRDKGVLKMKNNSDEIKALNTYYETANSEYDRIHKVFDQIDNKVGYLIAIIIGIPIATIGFASQSEACDFNLASWIFGIIGIISFLCAGWFTLQAIKVRDVKLGIPYKEFREYSREYDDKDMREWVSEALMKSSEYNYPKTLEKAKCVRKIEPFLIIETLSLLAAIISVLVGKL